MPSVHRIFYGDARNLEPVKPDYTDDDFLAEIQGLTGEKATRVASALGLTDPQPVNPEDVFEDFRDSVEESFAQVNPLQASWSLNTEPPTNKLTPAERKEIQSWLDLGCGVLAGPNRERIRGLIRMLIVENEEMRSDLKKFGVHYPGGCE